MKRHVDMADISDGRLYDSNAMVKAGCSGCGSCCKGMGTSIVLDPLDIYRMTSHLQCSFEMLMTDKIELNVVDGIILPNLKMKGQNESCGFLNDKNQCEIHPFRPGICRLFPLGRYYENNRFKYFLHVHECKNEHPSKVKIKKWLEEPELSRQEAFIRRWHYFLKNLQDRLDEKEDESLRKQVSMYILKKFYIDPISTEDDFYNAVEGRIIESEKMFGML
ncbi:MAG: YkgJ family cysteine cluster protein [Frisingicoccus sp.]|uniref:YkgJ family cysteine cluster protein n=1 Tax=Frisingicoccus sp. TaxID=1918627 RepID=UPI002632F9FB|nr:YkgJ family cysteine cluster protein [Frisingicoccus sp.]MDD6231938.1 YkgJ family cysteine cluster protein [Frisingicoccus sp.]